MKKKDNNIELGSYPNDKWKTFIETGRKFAEVEVNKWRASELLGYWCFKYKEHFNKDYEWKFNSPSPTKSYEIFRLNTCSTRLSSNPTILKDYIDWIFSQRAGIDKKSFRSISFLTADEQLMWYRNNILFAGQTNNNIDRSTPLPPNIKDIVSGLGCSTFGDLAFLMKADLNTDEIKIAKQQLEEGKFDFGVLDKIV